MDAIDCINTRKSIRKFTSDSVPQEVLTEVISIAQRSPSYKNSQPWEILILSGEKKEALTELMVGLLDKGVDPSPDLPEPTTWPTAENARIAHLYKMRAEKAGIDLTDPKVIIQAKKVNFAFYGAPHALYLLQDASLTLWSLFDLGLFAQSLMLAAHAKGLGTVPQAFATDYAREIKQFLNVPETKRLVLGLSIGYPDMEAPVNKLETDRSATSAIVTWYE